MHYKALATDYDGTIAHHGLVDNATVNALCSFKESGGKLMLVTGRELSDLFNVFPEPQLFDRIVAENGALLYDPATKNHRELTAPLCAEFPERVRELGVKSLSVGHVIVATQEVYLGLVEQAIRDCELDARIILNKGSLMVLPAGIDKAHGLLAACDELALARDSVVAVGDAENDIVLFKICGYSAAVANALPEVKAHADLVLGAGHGTGVRELIRLMLQDQIGPRLKQPDLKGFSTAKVQ